MVIAAAVGARSHGDHVARLRHLVVDLAQRRRHLIGERADGAWGGAVNAAKPVPPAIRGLWFSSVKIGFWRCAVTAECSCIISSGKWPNGRRLTARVAAKVRRAALAGRSRLVALERAGEFRAKRNRRSRPA